MNIMSLTTSYHTMSPSQTVPIQSHFITLDSFEMSVVNCMKKHANGRWSCKICGKHFNDIMMLVTHLLPSHNNASTTITFSNSTAIHICMLLEDSESIEMFQSYVRVAADDPDTDTKSEVRATPAHYIFV